MMIIIINKLKIINRQIKLLQIIKNKTNKKLNIINRNIQILSKNNNKMNNCQMKYRMVNKYKNNKLKN